MPQLNIATSAQRADPAPGAASHEPRESDVKLLVPEDQQEQHQQQQLASKLKKAQSVPAMAGASGAANAGPSASSAAQDGKARASQARGPSQGRPSVISTVRVAPSFADPESPRSPGKYSAW